MQQRKDPIRSKQTISVLFGRPKVLAATLAKTQSSQLSGASESSSPSSLAHVSRSFCHVASSMVHEWCHGFDAGHKRDQKGLEDVDGCICGCLFCCLLSWKNRKFYFCHSCQTLVVVQFAFNDILMYEYVWLYDIHRTRGKTIREWILKREASLIYMFMCVFVAFPQSSD